MGGCGWSFLGSLGDVHMRVTSAFWNSLVPFFQDSTLVAVRGNNFLSAKGPTDVASLEKSHD